MTVRSWRIDSLTVECTLDVVQQISAAVRDGFMRFPHGGLEIGGVLIGEGRGDVLRITGTRPIPIEYARGASFELTDADKSNLRALLQQTPDVVGWYVSHTRRGAVLTDRDKGIYEEFFGDAGQVCAVVKPAVDGAETWALYVRDISGAVISAGAHEDVEMGPWETLARGAAATSTAIEQPPVSEPEPPAPPITEPRIERPAPVPPIEPEKPPQNRRRWTRPAAAAAVILTCTAGAWYVSNRGGQKPATPAAASGERNRTTPAAATAAPPAQASPTVDVSKPAVEKQIAARKQHSRSKHVRRGRARARQRR